jgi:hypothetical protein|tara:strand:- start:193 stop:582 length:390 start_codon:yes stop_codon:yes gene_type:complete
MAWTIPGFSFTRVAGADLSSDQYKYVKLSTTDTVILCAAATDVPIGILQNAPASGAEATIMVTGISKVSSDAALSIGNQIGTSADGQADAKTAGSDTTEYVVGVVLEASSGAGALATATVNCLNPHRAS